MKSNEDEKQPQTWFVRHEGATMGPFPGSRIRHLLQSGELTLADEISTDRKAWVNLLQVPEVVPLPMRADAGDTGARAELERRRKGNASSRAEERRIPWLALVVSLSLVGGILGLAVWVGMPQEVDTPQCDAKPAPGVNWRNCILTGIDVGSASLAGANLNNSVLREAKFSATVLSDADLRYADLSGADLRYADLSRSQMLGANLRSADLRAANLTGVDLRFADLSTSQLEGASLQGAKLGGAVWVDGATCGENSLGRCVKPAQ